MSQVPATRKNQGGGLAARREHPLQRMQREFATLFQRLWGGGLAPSDEDLEAVRLWEFEVTENDQEIVVRAELPGFEEKEVDIQLDNDVLTIKAEKEQKGDGQEEFRSFFRRVTLPASVDAEKAQATYRNGILELHLPRQAGTQARHIAIQAQQNAGGQTGNGNAKSGDQAKPASSKKADK